MTERNGKVQKSENINKSVKQAEFRELVSKRQSVKGLKAQGTPHVSS